MHHLLSTSILDKVSQRVAPARLQLWVSEDFWQTFRTVMVPCGHLMAVMRVGSEFLAAQAATRQELKQTSPETPATTTQQFGGECV